MLWSQSGQRLCAKLGRVDVIEYDFGIEALGVLRKRHQLRSLTQRVGRPVVHVGGRHQLPPREA
jgi:hypothetical protein